MAIGTLRDLYIKELRDLYDGEQQNLSALKKMAQVASEPLLRVAFEEHAEETEQQLQRLRTILRSAGSTVSGVKCAGMQGIIQEGQRVMNQKKMPPQARDAALIAAAQRLEHYEMAGYESLRKYARLLGEREAARLLAQTLEEEWESDRRLALLADTWVNRSAAEPA